MRQTPWGVINPNSVNCPRNVSQRTDTIRTRDTNLLRFDHLRTQRTLNRSRAALSSNSAVYPTPHKLTVFNRSALPTTLTEDSAIAAAAMMGESSNPNVG
ncbi:hypothetical protein BN961_04121 [Afipia felis]|uniref:Uncharacterized protein n=1 Tax=Afipia felis TaxID=1035 RepID=A0A090MWI8_AFIFE|nr:hypothetical protein BN961_04121 [Afipia felis]